MKALEKFSNFELGHLDEIKCIKKSVFTVSLSTATEVWAYFKARWNNLKIVCKNVCIFSSILKKGEKEKSFH